MTRPALFAVLIAVAAGLWWLAREPEGSAGFEPGLASRAGSEEARARQLARADDAREGASGSERLGLREDDVEVASSDATGGSMGASSLQREGSDARAPTRNEPGLRGSGGGSGTGGGAGRLGDPDVAEADLEAEPEIEEEEEEAVQVDLRTRAAELATELNLFPEYALAPLIEQRVPDDSLPPGQLEAAREDARTDILAERLLLRYLAVERFGADAPLARLRQAEDLGDTLLGGLDRATYLDKLGKAVDALGR